MKKKKAGLTERQLEVLRLAAKGKSNKVISRRLFITDATVKAHLTQVYKKLKVINRTEAALKARDEGIIPPED